MNLAIKVLSLLVEESDAKSLAEKLNARVESIRNIISVLKALGLIRGRGRYIITDLGRMVLEANRKRGNVEHLAEIIKRIKSEEYHVLDRDEFDDERDRALLEGVIIES